MSSISTDDVRHLARLSNLQLSDQEIDAMGEDLANIVEYIKQLDELDTSNVEPTYQVTGLENIWRDDSVDDGGITSDTLLALAPEQQDHSVKVPQVL